MSDLTPAEIEHLNEDLSGVNGSESQEHAEEWAEDNGIELVDAEDEGWDDPEDQYIAEMIEAIEEELGQELDPGFESQVIQLARAHPDDAGNPRVVDAFRSLAPAAESGPTPEDHMAELVQLADEGADQRWTDEFFLQEQQLEQRLGRPITEAERQKLVEDQAGSDRAIDLIESYERVVGRDERSDEDRKDTMVEYMKEHDPEQWDPDYKEPPEPTNPDEERRDKMVADMEEVEAA